MKPLTAFEIHQAEIQQKLTDAKDFIAIGAIADAPPSSRAWRRALTAFTVGEPARSVVAKLDLSPEVEDLM